MTDLEKLEKLIQDLIDSQKHIHFTWGSLDFDDAVVRQEKVKRQIIDLFAKQTTP